MGNWFSTSSSSSSSAWESRGRNVLITGASSGIGAELARKFAREGARLFLLARNMERLGRIAKECQTIGAENVSIYNLDLTINKEIEANTQKIVQCLNDCGANGGGGAAPQLLDVIVLNAGRSQGCYFEEIQNVQDIDYMLKLNISGVIVPLQMLLPHMYKSRHSRIVFISSTAAVIPVPYRSIYSASKFAVTGFCNTLRMELNDTYGKDSSPKVTLITVPEVKGTALNEGRMTFGAKQPPVQFRSDTSLELEPTCEQIMKAIRTGVREWGTPLKVQVLAPLLNVFPDLLEGVIFKHLRKTHFRPEIAKDN